MLVNDFLDICDVNTKYFVRRCLSIGYTLTSNKDLYPEEYRIRYKGTIMNSNAENTFFIFLYVFSFMQKAKMLDYDIDLSWFTDKIKDGTYHIPSRTKEVLNYFLNDKRSLNTSELDFAFYNSIM